MREYLLVFLVAATVTYLLTVIAREIAHPHRGGGRGPRPRRARRADPLPRRAGHARRPGRGVRRGAAQLPFLSRSDPFVFRDAGVVLIAGAMICAVGVLDDIFELDALTKLGGQVLAAGFLVFNQIQFNYFTKPDGGQFSLRAVPGGAADRLRRGGHRQRGELRRRPRRARGRAWSASARSAFFLFCYQLAALNNVSLATTGALLSAALAGACVGFLPHNFHPARLFMGDSGSMLIGLVLSASRDHPHRAVPRRRDQPGRVRDRRQLGADAAAAGAAGVDPDAAARRPGAGRRTAHPGRPVARSRPDKQHLHHRMLEIGHSHRRAVFIMWLWAALIAFGTVIVSLYTGPWMWAGLALATTLTLAATFLLPVVHRPHAHLVDG